MRKSYREDQWKRDLESYAFYVNMIKRAIELHDPAVLIERCVHNMTLIENRWPNYKKVLQSMK